MAIAPDELPVPVPGWREHPERACRGHTDLFFAPKSIAKATLTTTDAMCSGCVVRESCLTASLLGGDSTYGRACKTSPEDRRRYRKKYGIKPPSLPTIESALGPLLRALELRKDMEEERMQQRALSPIDESGGSSDTEVWR
jgi:hypothetical protein